ncbi:hypothetical protein ACTG9Q_24555 [Actinokineospora sp. 24-640]
MSIDPMHLPIFGDPRPVDPPAAIRTAAALLLLQAVVTVVEVARAAVDPMLFAIPLLLTVWFTFSVRGGRDWARVAVCLSAFLSLALTIGLIRGVVDLVAVAVSATLLLTATRLMYRADVRDYFLPTTESEIV